MPGVLVPGGGRQLSSRPPVHGGPRDTWAIVRTEALMYGRPSPLRMELDRTHPPSRRRARRHRRQGSGCRRASCLQPDGTDLTSEVGRRKDGRAEPCRGLRREAEGRAPPSWSSTGPPNDYPSGVEPSAPLSNLCGPSPASPGRTSSSGYGSLTFGGTSEPREAIARARAPEKTFHAPRGSSQAREAFARSLNPVQPS